MSIKENDFIELDYTGTLEDGSLFDTTSEETAKRNKMKSDGASYRPVVICVGENQIVPGLDQFVIGKEAGKEYILTLPPEKAFGIKDVKKIRLVPLNVFKKQGIMPVPGLQVSIDGMRATLLRANGGRILVDFNHPLAGKTVNYRITIKRCVTDVTEQIKSYMKKLTDLPVEVKLNSETGTAAIVLSQELPKEITKELAQRIQKLTAIKSVVFARKEEEKSKPKSTRQETLGKTETAEW